MLDTVKQSPEIKKILCEFVKKPVEFLLLTGTVGTGKSFAAGEIYHHVTPYKLPEFDHDIAIFITQAELNIYFDKAQKKDNVDFLLKTYIHTKLLVLDDIGNRTPTPSFADFLYLIADKRYAERKNKGTIITTNLNHQQTIETFGAPFASRVTYNKCLRFEGKDRRTDPSYLCFLAPLIDYIHFIGSFDVFSIL